MNLNYPNTDSDRQAFDETIQKMVDSMVRVAAEKDLQKTLKGDLRDAYSSEPASVQKLAKLVYDNNVEGLLESTQELIETYNSVTGNQGDGK